MRHIPPLFVLICLACGGGPESENLTEVVEQELGAPCGAALPIIGVGASSAQEGNPASQAVDGLTATRWSGQGVGTMLTLNLGSVQALCGVNIDWYNGTSRQNNFKLSVSTDGTNYTDVFTGTSALVGGSQPYTFTSARSAKYLRYTFLGNTVNDWSSILEFRVNQAGPALIGSYKPTETTTGVPAGVTLKPYNTSGADLMITVDGTVLEGLDIYGDIKVRAKNVILRNSRLRGGKTIPSSASGIVNANHANVSNLLVENCTIIADTPSYYRDGIVGHDFTARRNHISKTNDGIGIFNVPGGSLAANVKVEGNYIHTLTFFSQDPSHADGTHNDGIQVQGGQNIHIVGNNILATTIAGTGSGPARGGGQANNGILLQQNVSTLANVLVEKNWIDYGLVSLYIDHTPSKGRTSITVTVQENRLGNHQFDWGNGNTYPIRVTDKSASTINGLWTNVWDANSAPLIEGKNGVQYNSL